MTTGTPSTRRAGRPRTGFTLIEMLVVIVIIALLIGIIGVVYTGALTGGRRASTEQFLRTLTLGIEQFKNDHGYYPPMIDAHKHAIEGIADPIEREEELIESRFHSIYTLPLYLIGVGALSPEDEETNPDPARHDGVDGPGFKSPGPDRSWGGAAERDNHKPPRTGRTYGPYIDVGSGRNFRLVSAGDPRPDEVAFENIQGLYTFEDRWGTPIRYYRYWPTKNRATPPAFSLDRAPIELLGVSTVEARRQSDEVDPSLERDLLNAPYALLSAGADGEFAVAPFVDEELDDMFSTAEELDDMTPDSPEWRALLDSLRDNVRALP